MLSCSPGNSGTGKKPAIKKPNSFLFEDEVDVNELGAETEAEKHLKVLLQKQLNTNISIKEQFSQHRLFSCPSTYTPATELIKGACTLDKFKEVEKNEELHQELQRCGLSEDEIADYFLHKSGKKRGKCKSDPAIWTNYINAIEEKIKAHNEELLKPQAFKNVKKLTRHEMDIEKSLYAGCPEKSKLATLVSILDEKQPLEIDSAFIHIKNFSKNLFKRQKKKKSKNNRDCSQILSSEETTHSDTEDSNFQYDPNIHHVTVPLEEDEVTEKRLSIEEIRQIPRFENYKTGNPSKTLYLKNLHPKTTIQELQSVFGSFQDENKVPIDYRLLTGRMKGQAFVRFSGVDIAEKALKHANGFSLRGKPIIIEFGRQN